MSLGALARFMNLPEEDEERWFDWVERMFSNALLDKDDQAEAVRDAEAYIDALIAERRQEPRDDFMGMLLEAEVDGQRLTDLEVRQFGVLMLLAGYETTSGAMGLSLLHLARAPGAAGAALRRPGRARAHGGERAAPLHLAGAGLLPERVARPRPPRRDRPRRRRRPARLRRGEPRPARVRPTPSAASSTGTRTATSRSATAATSAWARTSPGSSSRS